MIVPDTHETLKKARAVMAERGMAKRRNIDDQGHVCLRGAILIAAFGEDAVRPYGELWSTVSPGLSAARGVLMRRCEEAMGLIVDSRIRGAAWNDAPGTTEEMVLERFDKAIAATMPPEPEGLAPEPETRELVPA